MSEVLDPPRPRCTVPEDKHHELFKQWLHISDPDARSWVHWLREQRVVFILRVEARTVDGITGRFCMIYTHRFMIPARGGQGRWCCDES